MAKKKEMCTVNFRIRNSDAVRVFFPKKKFEYIKKCIIDSKSVDLVESNSALFRALCETSDNVKSLYRVKETLFIHPDENVKTDATRLIIEFGSWITFSEYRSGGLFHDYQYINIHYPV